MSIRLDSSTAFLDRHVGPDESERREMLETLGVESLERLAEEAVPRAIRIGRPLELPEALAEERLLARVRELASRNRLYRSFLGMGYHDTITPGVILRNVMENPAWYTQYTPYQAEVAQGRLEALLAFQTMCVDLTGLEIANASLLDEGTAAAEAMTLLLRHVGHGRKVFLVADDCHPQTIEVVKTRALPLGIDVRVDAPERLTPDQSVSACSCNTRRPTGGCATTGR